MELNGPLIHRLENVLTMDLGLHYFFDRLEIWLERRSEVSIQTVYPLNNNDPLVD